MSQQDQTKQAVDEFVNMLGDVFKKLAQESLNVDMNILEVVQLLTQRVLMLENQVSMLMDLHRIEEITNELVNHRDEPKLPFNGDN